MAQPYLSIPALDLQATATSIHRPSCHQRVGLVKPNDVVVGVQAGIKVTIPCTQQGHAKASLLEAQT